MAAAEAVEFPIVGRRSPEILRLVQTIRARLAAASPAARAGKRRKHPDRHQGSFAKSTELRPSDLDVVVVVNALAEEGSMAPSTVMELVRTARAQQPGRTVVVVLDEESPETVRAARDAGAFEFLGRDEIDNEEAVSWRFRNASLLSRVVPALEQEMPAGPVEPRPLSVRKSARLPAAALRKADAAIDAAAATLPTAEERHSHGADLLELVAPGLRSAETGRLDARRIAEATGLSLAALARASGVSQQALSATPDSPGAQLGLLPIARLAVMLDEMFSPEHKRVWLQTPHPRFGGRSPAQAIEAGNAELVALSVESALEGHPD